MTTGNIYQAVKNFEEEYIQFPPFQKAYKAIEENIALYRATGIAQHFLILGESGAGKSSLCQLIAQRYPRQELPERDVLPVLIVTVPAIVNLSSLIDEMLKGLGHPLPIKGSISNKTLSFITLCKACSVEMILFDEAQQLHDRGQVKSHYMVGDWIKRLIDELNIPTVFLGLPRLESLLQVNEQLRRRFSKKHYLAFGQNPDDSAHSECLQLFISLGASMPIRLSCGDYGWEQFGERLSFACDGRVSYIKKIMSAALRFALELKLDEITPKDFEVIYKNEIWIGAENKLNPFNSNFVFRRLDRGGEPFEAGRTK